MCGFEGSADNLAAMARWTHPYPCRTRKLSIAAATIVGNGKNSTLPVCPVPKGTPFFLPFFPEAVSFHRRGEGTCCIHRQCECSNPVHTYCEQDNADPITCAQQQGMPAIHRTGVNNGHPFLTSWTERSGVHVREDRSPWRMASAPAGRREWRREKK